MHASAQAGVVRQSTDGQRPPSSNSVKYCTSKFGRAAGPPSTSRQIPASQRAPERGGLPPAPTVVQLYRTTTVHMHIYKVHHVSITSDCAASTSAVCSLRCSIALEPLRALPSNSVKFQGFLGPWDCPVKPPSKSGGCPGPYYPRLTRRRPTCCDLLGVWMEVRRATCDSRGDRCLTPLSNRWIPEGYTRTHTVTYCTHTQLQTQSTV